MMDSCLRFVAEASAISKQPPEYNSGNYVSEYASVSLHLIRHMGWFYTQKLYFHVTWGEIVASLGKRKQIAAKLGLRRESHKAASIFGLSSIQISLKACQRLTLKPAAGKQMEIGFTQLKQPYVQTAQEK